MPLFCEGVVCLRSFTYLNYSYSLWLCFVTFVLIYACGAYMTCENGVNGKHQNSHLQRCEYVKVIHTPQPKWC
jgi:hypothetical protein